MTRRIASQDTLAAAAWSVSNGGGGSATEASRLSAQIRACQDRLTPERVRAWLGNATERDAVFGALDKLRDGDNGAVEELARLFAAAPLERAASGVVRAPLPSDERARATSSTRA